MSKTMEHGHAVSKIVLCNAVEADRQALRLLHGGASNTLLSRTYDEPSARSFLSSVDTIFSDIDGTLTDEGAPMSAECIAALLALAKAGKTVTLVTGRSYDEVAGLMSSLPRALSLHVIYEKGGYEFVRDADGDRTKHLLATQEIEGSAAAVRRVFWQQKATLERRYANVTFGWAGTGQHQSLVSIDAFQGAVPPGYAAMVGSERSALKVKDTQLLARIAYDLAQFLKEYQPAWQVTHLLNGNFELGPKDIAKDEAIRQTERWRRARAVLLLGDGPNDRSMFALRAQGKAAAGLVLHREAALALVSDVDFVSFGRANPYPFFTLLSRVE
ncbi:MAG TPA: HAD-IIB family hydrolase [Candidatus Saccharimonadales bacterium]|nr:HAD-IIB family hydrolase [Candidatus Saccharimonadales bacterium]